MATSSVRLHHCTAALACALLLPLGGCRSRGNPFHMSAHAAAWNASKQSARQDLSAIPLPSKSTYLAIDQQSQWQNPFLTVESNMIQLRIFLADQNSSDIDRGGMTRLSSARKHTLNIRPKDLPRALAALPSGAWPYGRVVAVGEERPGSRNRTTLANNVSVTIAALQDMGLVVDDWTDPSRLVH
ncbi:MAG: hypothetical protein ABI164_09130 [Acidobacteriaceae bacterium]